MAHRPPRRSATRILALVVGSGLAAAIAAIGGFATQTAKIEQETEASRCALAAAILQDETLSPYIAEAEQGKLVRAAAMRFRQCMEQPK